MLDFEKLGAFYLGKKFSPTENKTTDDLILYDSKDLTTHAVCVGMTGSGKTGLGISLIEEAVIDGIPVMVIDPKGDMTNLLLTFPDLLPENFVPWVNANEAANQGLTVEQFAQKQAEVWEGGLKKWGQSKDRIKRLKEAAEFAIYTPGSSAGISLSILKSLSAPPPELIEDHDLFSEQIVTTVSSLLGLLKIDADPIKSREHILISNILTHFWGRGQDLDLSQLIHAIQTPPFNRIGVFEMNDFYPAKERLELAIALNNLLASPSFQSWLEGEPLDIQQLLYTPTGKPRVPVLYIAHLSDAERMFFVSILLNQLLGWMRSQPGTTSLRALLYIDELFGYMPPIGNPPSKITLLTLLKQARAFGLGLVLSTQNPVDLDYKGLSNAGTWFIGRLQTDRDRERMLDGLTSASTAQAVNLNKKTLENILSGLGKRKFLLHNVHEDGPEVFETRWVMSYLSGPMTRAQIKNLMGPRKSSPATSAQPTLTTNAAAESRQPTIPSDVNPLYLPVRTAQPEKARLLYKPYVWGSADIYFDDKPNGVDLRKAIKILTPITDQVIAVDWAHSQSTAINENELLKSGDAQGTYEPVPQASQIKKNYPEWEKELKDFIFRNHKIELFKSSLFKLTSRPDETRRDFVVRLSQLAREQDDDWRDKLRTKYSSKIEALETKIRRAQDKLAKEEADVTQHKLESTISIGTTLLGAFMGRKAVGRSSMNRAGRAISGSIKESQDVDVAKTQLAALEQQAAELDQEFQREVAAFEFKKHQSLEDVDLISVSLKKTNVNLKFLNFVWVPFWQKENEAPVLAIQV
jgi:hypothetical protein